MLSVNIEDLRKTKASKTCSEEWRCENTFDHDGLHALCCLCLFCFITCFMLLECEFSPAKESAPETVPPVSKSLLKSFIAQAQCSCSTSSVSSTQIIRDAISKISFGQTKQANKHIYIYICLLLCFLCVFFIQDLLTGDTVSGATFLRAQGLCSGIGVSCKQTIAISIILAMYLQTYCCFQQSTCIRSKDNTRVDVRLVWIL